MYRDRACDKRMIGLEARSAELYLARRGGELFAAQSYVPFTITALRATQAEPHDSPYRLHLPLPLMCLILRISHLLLIVLENIPGEGKSRQLRRPEYSNVRTH